MARDYNGFLAYVGTKQAEGIPLSELDEQLLGDPFRADALGDSMIVDLLAGGLAGPVAGALRGGGAKLAAGAAGGAADELGATAFTIARTEGATGWLTGLTVGNSSRLSKLMEQRLAAATGQLAINKESGAIAELLMARLIMEAGHGQFATHVTMYAGTTRFVADAVVKVGQNIYVLEAKFGGAGLTKAQRIGYAALRRGELVRASGGKAAQVGLDGETFAGQIGKAWWAL